MVSVYFSAHFWASDITHTLVLSVLFNLSKGQLELKVGQGKDSLAHWTRGSQSFFLALFLAPVIIMIIIIITLFTLSNV